MYIVLFINLKETCTSLQLATVPRSIVPVQRSSAAGAQTETNVNVTMYTAPGDTPIDLVLNNVGYMYVIKLHVYTVTLSFSLMIFILTVQPFLPLHSLQPNICATTAEVPITCVRTLPRLIPISAPTPNTSTTVATTGKRPIIPVWNRLGPLPAVKSRKRYRKKRARKGNEVRFLSLSMKLMFHYMYV